MGRTHNHKRGRLIGELPIFVLLVKYTRYFSVGSALLCWPVACQKTLSHFFWSLSRPPPPGKNPHRRSSTVDDVGRCLAAAVAVSLPSVIGNLSRVEHVFLSVSESLSSSNRASVAVRDVRLRLLVQAFRPGQEAPGGELGRRRRGQRRGQVRRRRRRPLRHQDRVEVQGGGESADLEVGRRPSSGRTGDPDGRRGGCGLERWTSGREWRGRCGGEGLQGFV